MPLRAREPMPGRIRRAPLWPWLLLLLVSLGMSGTILWTVWPSVSVPLKAGLRPVGPASSPRSVGGERRPVRLFFPQAGNDALREQERELPARATLADSVRDVVRALGAGAAGVQSPLPPGAEVRQVFLDDLGILYLDFTKEIRAIGSAGGPPAGLSVSALVTTLTTNFGEVKRVRLLAEGHELTEVVGGVDLGHPILPRFPGEEAAPPGGEAGAAEPPAQ